MDTRPKKIAIVHDWMVGGGAERVVFALHQMYPQAPVYTSYCTPEWRQRMGGKVVTGWLQHFGKIRKFIPFLRIWWFTRLDLRDYDLVISSSGAEAKGIKVREGAEHINYCHAPTHYYWSRYDEYMKHPGFGVFDPIARVGLKLLVGPLRTWDYAAAQRPSAIAANSTYTKQAIKRYYGRDAKVIFPPIDIERFKAAAGGKRHGFVIAGRQTPYKRVDLAVRACTKLDLPLTVIGNGPDHERLKAMAGPSITFKTGLNDTQVAEEFKKAEAFIFPNVDDFGVVAVEALSAGTPVIALKAGGSLDYVEPGKTGLFFDEQTVDGLCHALKDFPNHRFNHALVAESAVRFSTQEFKARFDAFVQVQSRS
ncbi:MAG TPA: glycosyltransferase [Candidatus Saccharimonadales bacterium]|nr:glycosyltransferase [Candidatus Saccharimonadales bacterium]